MEPIKLTTPTLYSIFMQGGFTDDEIPETKASISKLNEALTRLVQLTILAMMITVK